MRILEELSADEMALAFVQGELASERFGARAKEALAGEELTPEVARRVLAAYRGLGEGRDVFGGFPDDVRWFRAVLAREELHEVLYIGWEYWLEQTNGTRRPQDFDDEWRDDAVARLVAAPDVPPMILVSRREGERLVVLEGHVRLTSYVHAGERAPGEVQAIVGFSDTIERWASY